MLAIGAAAAIGMPAAAIGGAIGVATAGRGHLSVGALNPTSIRYGPKVRLSPVAQRGVLVDRRAVEDRAGRAAEVDHSDVAAGHFDDRVHARHGLVVQAQVAALELADLDDVLGQGLGLDELVAVVDD